MSEKKIIGIAENVPTQEEKYEEKEQCLYDFDRAFFAGFFHYRNDPPNRFPGAVDLLYLALYDPNELERVMNINADTKQDNVLERRFTEIKNICRYANLENIPKNEEFKRVLKLCLRHGSEIKMDATEDSSRRVKYNKEEIQSFESALYPDVWEAVSNLWDKYDAQMVIWTAGDNSPWKGQLHKVANSLNALRNSKHFGSRKKDMLSIVTENDKMDHLAGIFFRFKESGINNIILVEDRLKHLKDGMEIAKKSEVSCTPVWVRREGTEFENVYPEKNIDESAKIAYQEEYNAVSSFADIQKILEKKAIKKEDKIGMIIDFDGVLSDSALTNRIWAKSIVDTLIKNNWIKTTESK